MGVPEKNNRAFIGTAVVIVVGVLATTLAQPQVLARIPLQNLLKNELHVDRTANAAFFFWAGLAWYFKPFAGILTDAFPIFGSRRKNYILISTILCLLSWVGLYFTPHEYSKLLWACIVINLFMVVASTVIGGYMVEVAQAISASGRLTAIREFVQQATGIITGPSAGYLASIAFGSTAAACGGVMFLLAGDHLLSPRTTKENRFPRTAGKRRQAIDQYRRGKDDVGGRRVDGTVLYRPRFFDRNFLPAAERNASGLPRHKAFCNSSPRSAECWQR